MSEAAVAGWRAACRTTPGCRRRFPALAIKTSVMLGAVQRLPLRQTEGFVRSLMDRPRAPQTAAPSLSACPHKS